MGTGKQSTEAEKVKITILKNYNQISNRQIAKEIDRSKKCVSQRS